MRRRKNIKTTDKIKVIIENRQKAVKIPTGIRMLLRRCCNAVLTLEGFEGDAEVNILFVDDETMKKLNHKHRNINKTTDVLSFPLGENDIYDINPETGSKMLGDIVLSIPRAVKQAEEYEHSLQREMGYLTAHSMLHLLGYDHENGGLDGVYMREKEEKVMQMLGYPKTSSYVYEE
ncbi:MAG: rRNA maturation RNase YbeY [Clostridiales bacterium 43-6]|nr:MAG: rRNA maturation RNase YbeY [Clostridiales bacterium 43-6]